MKYPNMYVIIVGPPGSGKSQLASNVSEILRSRGKSCEVSEGDRVPSKEWFEATSTDCSISSLTEETWLKVLKSWGKKTKKTLKKKK